jgi:hypothetical protein
MEARPDDLYGNSLRLVIPRLEIKNLSVKNSVSPSCFSGIEPLTLSAPQSEETDRGRELNDTLQTYPEFIVNVQANEVIILMINSFVDFFIQYYHAYKEDLNPLILKLKEIIFYSTNQSALASIYNELIGRIKSKLNLSLWPEWEEPKSYFFPKNAGREFLHDAESNQRLNTRLETLTGALLHSTTDSHRMQLQKEMDETKSFLDILSKDELFIIYATKFQKFEIFSLLFLSYHVLSTSGFFFTIEIKDLDEILLQEIERTPSSSFILQFLPHDRIIINIIKTNLLQFFMRYSEIYMPALRALRDAPELQRLRRDAGGSKRVNNKSRKNKYKHKCNHKYKKSRKNKRHRRKRTQSNQNNMF